MQTLDEERAVERVSERLVDRFPDVPEATVRALVNEAHDSLDGPIRAYVPVLVEHAARDRLAHLPRAVVAPRGVAALTRSA